MKPLSTEKKLALKISFIAFLVLVCIILSIIISSFAYGWSRTFNEFMNEQRMFDEGPIIKELLTGKTSDISGRLLGWHGEEMFRRDGPRKGPRDIIVFDKNKNILKNEVLEMTKETQKNLFSISENDRKNLLLGERRFLVVKKENKLYTIFLLHDITPMIKYYEDILLVSLLGSVFGFLIIFIMANHLAKITIQPIKAHNKELESYSHNVAHELRTPLAVMRQNLELFKIKPTEQLIDSTNEEITGMERIIEALLFLAKPKTQGLEKARVNLNNFLSEIVRIYGKEVSYIRPKKPIHKMLHIELFKRVLDNLIQNSKKYKSEGLIIVNLTEEKLIISNNIEANLSPKDITELTKAFYQGDISRNSSGYGLGLAIVKKIIELEGWALDIKTENSRFIVEISFS